ncbi:MAG: asparagine synthase (glutamine-hydrolyzing), partial [Bacillota bacterium]|nr:asparagine synthase (glutamine-hydrolyzing) [Bacillota bacterium]
FNGEIYNYKALRKKLEAEGYRLRTQTDTEVILGMYELYGAKCLDYFNGMFAFAIFDRKEDKLFIARDRVGIRPLYYFNNQNGFAFASEIKALLKCPFVKRAVNKNVIGQYVQFRYVDNPSTLFDGVLKLEPGHYMMYDGKNINIQKYWDVEVFEKNQGSLEENLIALEALLEESVKLRMISDVSLGAFLSGGIDSSLIVALMAKLSNAPVKTFSVGFKDSNYSELPYAKSIADKFKTDHHELYISHKDIMDNLYSAVWHRDAPVSESSDIPILLLSREAKKKVSVILTGEGSDEIFAGYPKYAFDKYSKAFWFKTFFNNSPMSSIVNSLPYKYRKIKLAYNTLRIENDLERFASWFSSFRRDSVNKLFTDDFINNNHSASGYSQIKGVSDLDKMMYLDLKYWLTDNLLERGDKMLMSASVEGRVPFLDFNVVEQAYRIKDSFKIHGNCRKYIVKKLAEKYIPAENIYRKKVGFYIPVGDWFRRELRDFVYDHLMSRRFIERGIFKPSEIENIVVSHCSGKQNYEKELWMLINLEIWFRSYIDCS